MKLVAKKRNWIALYKGVRKSVFHTFHYLLSHCGINKKNHTVIWFGSLSYGKVKHKEPKKKSGCPACGQKLVPIYYDGIHPVVPPEQYFDGFVDSEDWYEVKTLPDSDNKSEYKFEYDPRKETNEILGSLAIS